MIKIFFSGLLLSLSLYAQTKPIMIMVYNKNCPDCIQTINLIRNDQTLLQAINQYTKFIMISEEEAAQKQLYIRKTPTFFFYDGEQGNSMLVPPLEGGIADSHDFARYLKAIYMDINHLNVKSVDR